jgi:hypothetical protein
VIGVVLEHLLEQARDLAVGLREVLAHTPPEPIVPGDRDPPAPGLILDRALVHREQLAFQAQAPEFRLLAFGSIPILHVLELDPGGTKALEAARDRFQVLAAMARSVDRAPLALRLRFDAAVVEYAVRGNPGPPVGILSAGVHRLGHRREQHVAVEIAQLPHLPPQRARERLGGGDVGGRTQEHGEPALRLPVREGGKPVRTGLPLGRLGAVGRQRALDGQGGGNHGGAVLEDVREVRARDVPLGRGAIGEEPLPELAERYGRRREVREVARRQVPSEGFQ